jgi:hypothetical protein
MRRYQRHGACLVRHSPVPTPSTGNRTGICSGGGGGGKRGVSLGGDGPDTRCE